MTYLVLRIMINALSIAAAVKLVDGIIFVGEWWKIIIIGLIFGLVNALIKPIIKFFTFPFIILTLGLFTLVINALMFGLTAYLSDTFELGLHLSGFWPALKGAFLISVISAVLSWFSGANTLKDR